MTRKDSTNWFVGTKPADFGRVPRQGRAKRSTRTAGEDGLKPVPSKTSLCPVYKKPGVDEIRQPFFLF